MTTYKQVLKRLRMCIADCPGCGEDHENLEVRYFRHPLEIEWREWEVWGKCPVTSAPVLVGTFSPLRTETL